MTLPNMTQLKSESIAVNGNRETTGLPIYMSVGIRLSKPSRWAPFLPYGPSSPVIGLTFVVNELNISEVEADPTEPINERITMTMEVSGRVSSSPLKLVNMDRWGEAIIAELEFYSNQAVKIKVRHDGQPRNHTTYYMAVPGFNQFGELKRYLRIDEPNLVKFVP